MSATVSAEEIAEEIATMSVTVAGEPLLSPSEEEEDGTESEPPTEMSSTESNEPTTRKKVRKRLRNPASWKKNKRKQCRNSGKKYISDTTKQMVRWEEGEHDKKFSTCVRKGNK